MTEDHQHGYGGIYFTNEGLQEYEGQSLGVSFEQWGVFIEPQKLEHDTLQFFNNSRNDSEFDIEV